MENISRKISAVHERADSTEEVFGVERQLQGPHNDCRNSKDTCAGSQGTVALIQVLTALIGNFNSPYRKLYRSGLVLWIFHLTTNTIWDGYASRDKYGHPWVVVRGLLWVTCIVCTWLTICRTVPWLEQGLGILEFDRQYKDVLLDMSSATRKIPSLLALFSITAGSLQYGMMQKDQATHLAIGLEANEAFRVILHVVRFVSGVHVYFALALFWSIPTSIMLMAGYSMAAFQEITQTRLKNKKSFISLKHAVGSYQERVQFVKDSSHACMVVLSLLIVFTVVSLAVNVYVFLFIHRSSYLYIIHALLPLTLAAYPLHTASWVTKQYHWHLVAVVQAWINISDSESDSDSELSDPQVTNNNGHATVPLTTDQNDQRASEANLRANTPGKTTCITVKPWREDRIYKLQNVFSGSARFIGKLRHKKEFRRKFQFEKYIRYLEKVSRREGFSIGVVLITWELVSALFFFLISLITLFIQESIFGKAESTIKM
ncbi:uncharacterized protein LOC141885109 [Acropora palmata]|uniref:uncharacterized protein LOC141885109 n=1 Tax=Acropora palmata TaxID=6131 RepID=UPI003D9FCBEA